MNKILRNILILCKSRLALYYSLCYSIYHTFEISSTGSNPPHHHTPYHLHIKSTSDAPITCSVLLGFHYFSRHPNFLGKRTYDTETWHCSLKAPPVLCKTPKKILSPHQSRESRRYLATSGVSLVPSSSIREVLRKMRGADSENFSPFFT